MKHCNKSHKCPYGNAFEEGLCAYKKDLNEYDLCPSLLENWEKIIDDYIKMTEEVNNNAK